MLDPRSDIPSPRQQSQEGNEYRRSDDCPDYGEGRATDLQSEDFRQSKLSDAPGSKFPSFPN